MRRFLVAFLVAGLMFTFGSCSRNNDYGKGTSMSTAFEIKATNEEMPTVTDDTSVKDIPSFYAGYSRVDLTPYDYSVPLNSTIDSVGVFAPIYATCVAVSDGEKTALFITVDVRNITNSMARKMLDMIEEEFAIPSEQVIISATHNHSSPDTGLTNRYQISKWLRTVYALVPNMVREAVDDLAPTVMKIGRSETPNMNFVRRYLMGDGSYKSVATTNPNKDYVAHESDADTEFQTILFEREGAKNIVMVNWQAHAAHALGLPENMITADFITQFRSGAEEKYDVCFAYYQGACGNINLHSNIAGEMIYKNYIQVALALVNVLGDALDNAEKAETGEIAALSEIVTVSFKDNGGVDKLPISAISIGDVAFIAAPYEMFDKNGVDIKTASEFKMTFICGYANGRYGYIPTSEAFPHGEYEVRSCKYVQGTAEQIAQRHISLLEKLFKLSNQTEEK